jgi:UDP-N-acetylglucosamine diphosphorylase / glucose-1-phosphate thymidylyltransferase / UDP-N-acetylgalactosamine diphosphorylase / glucosamine-1-phosphate N-acetyltransferase / galactosamine-1-phosphate N-acetyltransferase
VPPASRDELLTSDLFGEGEGEQGILEFVLSFRRASELLKGFDRLFSDLTTSKILGSVEPGAHIVGPVHIGKGSRIHPDAVVYGPTIIGEGVSVRPHAQVRAGTYLGSHCVVGHGADIKHSLCLDGAKMQDGVFVGDSVIGFGARVGSGAILANRKFNQSRIALKTLSGRKEPTNSDFIGAMLGDYVRLGANVVLSPGTVVYPHTWIGSGVVASGTYDRELLITLTQELNIREKGATPLESGQGDYEVV